MKYFNIKIYTIFYIFKYWFWNFLYFKRLFQLSWYFPLTSSQNDNGFVFFWTASHDVALNSWSSTFSSKSVKTSKYTIDNHLLRQHRETQSYTENKEEGPWTPYNEILNEEIIWKK